MTRRVTIRNILLISILAIAGVLSVVIFRKFQPPVVQKVEKALSQNVDVAFKKITYTETRGKEKLWTLSADSADHDANKEQMALDNVHMVFFSLGEFGDVTLVADKGFWYQGEGRIDLEGNVEAQGTRGHAFYTQKLTFLQEKGLIRSDLPVKIIGPGMEVIGTGLRMDTKTRQINLLSQVRGKLND
jgi:LPS export ABC transporter protein LptC